jgi:amino acid transporter
MHESSEIEGVHAAIASAAFAPRLARILSLRDVAVAATSYIVASTTLVSDLAGWLTYGSAFVWPLAVAFVVNLLLALSVAQLAESYPRCGAIYSFASAVLHPLRGHRATGVFLAVVFIGMTMLAGASEVSSGAYSLKALLGSKLDTSWFVLALVVAAVLPNLFGLRVTARVVLVAVIAMVGLRWTFGAVGFFGWSRTGDWSAARVFEGGPPNPGMSVPRGLALAFWTFVGVEVVAPYAEELKRGSRLLTHGMVIALLVVLANSLVMGLGIAGAIPHHEWSRVLSSDPICGGDCPHLGVGRAMLGQFGAGAMALSAVAACYGTVVVGLSGTARIVHALGRDEALFGDLSPWLGQATADGRPPRTTLLVTATLLLLPPLFLRQVVPWLLPAALIWVLLYVVFHVLALVDCLRHLGRAGRFGWRAASALLGMSATLVAVPAIFRDADASGLVSRALWVLLVAAGVTALPWIPRGVRAALGSLR